MASTITIDKTIVKAGETAWISLTFPNNETMYRANGLVRFLTVTGGSLNHGTLIRIAAGTNTYRVQFIPTEGLEKSDAKVRYDSPNDESDGELTFAIDTLRPTVASASIAKSDLRLGEKTTITITFSERVTRSSFTIDDLQVDAGKGTLSNLRVAPSDTTATTAAATTWLVDLEAPATRPATGLHGNQIRINLDGITDVPGNAGASRGVSVPARYNIDDGVPPTGTIALSATSLKAGETMIVTFTFSENVPNFGLDAIQYDTSKGTLSALTQSSADSKVWTATYTPRSDTENANNTIRLNLASIRDAQGNAGSGTPSSGNFSIDTLRPTVDVTISDNRLTVGETATITFTFRESVTGFDLGDVQYDTSKGTLGALTAVGTDGKVWSATYTPRPDIESTENTIRVNLSGVRDARDNAGEGTATSGNFSIDTRPPVNVTISDNRLTAGETATITFTFNERVTGFTKEAIDLSQANGTLGDLTPVGTDGKAWTATFTPTANLARTTNHRLTLNLANVRNAAGNTVANNTYAFNQYTVDTMVFALSSATANRDQLVLSYSDATALDGNADRAPTNESFTVLVDGTRIDVSRVTVDAAARTVTLTLARAVTTGQQVTVAYQDTDTSDNKALQEAGTGDDAASFAARAVTNLTQPPVAPATPEAPGAGAPDDDRDGVPNSLEDQAAGLLRPDGSAGLAGDGNGDGIKDSQQVAVASTRDQTLVAGSQNGKLLPDSNARITELVRSDAPANLPKGMEMPIGLTSFKASLAEGRSTESFSLYVDPALGANGYWLKNGAGIWVNLASEPYGGKVASEGGRTRLDFQIQDGGQYDADGLVNGSISVPGAVAKMPLSIVGQASDAHSFGFWY
ncbi:hypothetical protein D5045_14625 [Verminephrobacter eiseniae]|nr:hypothetical protein [Verminephrobacter eiseniae]